MRIRCSPWRSEYVFASTPADWTTISQIGCSREHQLPHDQAADRIAQQSCQRGSCGCVELAERHELYEESRCDRAQGENQCPIVTPAEEDRAQGDGHSLDHWNQHMGRVMQDFLSANFAQN